MLEFTERRGRVLTPSGLACLAGAATVNVTRGCAHGCIYCYGRGYARYPGDGRLVVYRDTARRVAAELARKRRRPAAVYFCPSCDAFQPVEAVREQSHATMAAVLAAGVAVEFVTKGVVPERFLDLFARHTGRVAGQVGLTTLDDAVRRVLEPGAATVTERLRAVERLRQAGVAVSVRAEPLVHGVPAVAADGRQRGVAGGSGAGG
jgi:DNA repair photolyase